MRFSSLWVILPAMVASAPVGAQPFEAGQTYFGPSGQSWIEYQAGDLPLIFSAPHGGYLEPASLPDRSGSGIVTVRDSNTQELALTIAEAVETRTGRRAHLILSRLARVKLDPNRDIGEGALGDPGAESAWQSYHDYLAAAREAVLASPPGRGFLVDLHGHGHAIQRLELGYDVTENDLLLGDATLRRPYYKSRSSIRELAARSGVPFIDLLRGPQSLGQLLFDRGYASVPSQSTPNQGVGNPYFDGGYITETYTSRTDFGRINGVQVEAHSTGVRDTENNRIAFANALLDALDEYLRLHEGLALGLTPRLSFEWVEPRRAEGQVATLRIRRTGRIDVAMSGTLVFAGIATSEDYTAPSSSFSLPVGTDEVDIVVPILADAINDGTETLTVDVSVASTVGVDGTRPAVLHVEDATTVQVRVAADVAEVIEGDSAVFRVLRTSSNAAQVVSLAVGGTARAGWDYRGLIPTAVAFAVGEAGKVIVLPAVADERLRDARTLSLSVSGGVGYQVGVPAGATVTLVDRPVVAEGPVFHLGGAAGSRARDLTGDRWVTRLPSTADGPVVGGTATRPEWTFDGTEDALLTAPVEATIDGSYSVAAWFRVAPFTPVSGNVRGMISWGDFDTPQSLHVYIVESTSQIRTSLRDLDDVSDTTALDAGSTFANGSWHHYALTVDTMGTSRVYINGILRRTANRGGGAMGEARHVFVGWREGSSTNRHWPGGVADLRWYHRVLTAAEITALSGQVSSWQNWAAHRGLSAAQALAAVDRRGNPFPARFATGQLPDAPANPLELRVEADGTRRFLWLERGNAPGLVVTPERLVGGVFGPLGGAGSSTSETFEAPGETWVERSLTFPSSDSVDLVRLRVAAP